MLSLHSFSTFINFSVCSFQIFFQSFTLTFTSPLSLLRQLTPTTSFFSPTLCLTYISLQKATTGQILTPKDLFGFCIKNTTGIKVFFVSILKKSDLLSQYWLNDLRTVELCQGLSHIIALVFPKITNVFFFPEFSVMKCLGLSLSQSVDV